MTPGIGEPEGGPSARFLAGQAAEHGVWVGGTCPEIARRRRWGGRGRRRAPYNSFVLAGPDGTMHRYRKIHPFTYGGEHERFRAGDEAGHGRGRRACGSPCSSATTCASPTSSGRRRPDTDVYLVPANWPSRPAAALADPAAGPGDREPGLRGRLQPGGRRRATAPSTPATAASSARWGSCWPPPPAWRRVVLADVDPAEVAATRDRLRFLPDRRG